MPLRCLFLDFHEAAQRDGTITVLKPAVIESVLWESDDGEWEVVLWAFLRESLNVNFAVECVYFPSNQCATSKSNYILCEMSVMKGTWSGLVVRRQMEASQ